MKFSTKIVREMAKMAAREMKELGGENNLLEMETEMRKLLKNVGAEALGMVLEERDEEIRKEQQICKCGNKLSYLQKRSATILSVFGPVNYKRSYYVCKTCKKGETPLHRRYGIAAGEITPGLGEMIALVGVEVAFAEASKLLNKLLLVSISDNTIRKETERFGCLQQEIEKEWKEQSQNEDWLQARQHEVLEQRERLYGSIDGVMAPLQKEWRELKNIVWYNVEGVKCYQKRRHHAKSPGEQNDLQAKNISYHCDIQPAEEFSELFWATACQRKADRCKEVVFVCDGAAWIWKMIERNFPDAVQIVDWYHASEYLPPAAEAAFGRGTSEYDAWLEEARQLLWDGQIDDLIQKCRSLEKITENAQPIHSAISYFSNNQHRMKYAQFREQGYYIGSGTVESACKQISTLRLKRAGARWSELGAVQTAKARAAWLSGNWSTLVSRRAALSLAV